MGTGSSGLSKSGGGSKRTPSGVTFSQFMQMNESQKLQTISDILGNTKITVPSHLDNSATSKVIYALGMNNKPNVVTDKQLDGMNGEEIFRTVYDVSSPPPFAKDITSQIRKEDFTQMSGSGGSAFGRALYFATDFGSSKSYGYGKSSATMMRGKIDKKAKIIGDKKLENLIAKDPRWNGMNVNYADKKALYALSHGIDGWKGSGYGRSYRMIVNRGVLSVSSQDKNVSGWSSDWHSSPNK